MAPVTAVFLSILLGAAAEHTVKFESPTGGHRTVRSLPAGDILAVVVPNPKATGFEWYEVSRAADLGVMAYVNKTEVNPPATKKGGLSYMVFRYRAERASQAPSKLTLVHARSWEKHGLRSFANVTITMVTEKLGEAEHTVKFDSEDGGHRTVRSLPAGDTLAVSLPNSRATGFEWHEVSRATDLGVMAYVSKKEVNPPQGKKGGVSHVVFRYRAERASQVPSNLKFVHARPWEKPDPLRSFANVTITMVTEKFGETPIVV